MAIFKIIHEKPTNFPFDRRITCLCGIHTALNMIYNRSVRIFSPHPVLKQNTYLCNEFSEICNTHKRHDSPCCSRSLFLVRVMQGGFQLFSGTQAQSEEKYYLGILGTFYRILLRHFRHFLPNFT